ncbi:transcriptional regulator [Streptomyces subrutilus]|uniref:Transcriptional regulator n=1 Tax=Streptomyces subrutilus TaxID=36818 RepID=A0A5P2UQ20_9ACTN|nr:PadR family transcriptional regulator [Streptomyces subrutilus]QEU79711.1 PadR family transcriptional regulator [Streptomyces subrutilus]GGZ67675.1 transcriptional regulator [Streptomyces subrutilus]
MSIRHGLLALLERGPRYGSQLRTEFESRTGSTWPLNVGQVYTTLARLERDGLVAPGGEDPAGHTLYAITDTGRAELRAWYERPVDRAHPPRDELSIKLAMAVGAPGVDIRAVIQSQRHATIRAMQDYTRLKARALAAVEGGRAGERDDVAWLLVLEQLIFQTEAEARWLDHCEARLVRLSLPADGRAAAPGAPQAPRNPAGTAADPTAPHTAASAGNTAAAPTTTATTTPRTARTRRG